MESQPPPSTEVKGRVGRRHRVRQREARTSESDGVIGKKAREEQCLPFYQETFLQNRVWWKTLGCLRDARDHPMSSGWGINAKLPFAVALRAGGQEFLQGVWGLAEVNPTFLAPHQLFIVL